MTIWFTSDTHYGHKNVIKYCNRPFATVEEMDETMIANYNSVVQNNDTVYHIGDYCFSKDGVNIARRLKGNKFLIEGNHDHINPELAKFFKEISQYKEIRWEGEKIIMCHYAFRVWNKSHHGSWNLHGHSHNTLPPIGKQLDVGVDVHNFFPISFEQVKKIMDKKTFKSVDHHDEHDDDSER